MNEKCVISDWEGSLRLTSSALMLKKSNIYFKTGYNAPEIDWEYDIKNKKINYYLCDVYSLGIVVLRLFGISYKGSTYIFKEEFAKQGLRAIYIFFISAILAGLRPLFIFFQKIPFLVIITLFLQINNL